MKSIEWQVTSLEISKQLKNLGIKQESYFYWCDGILPQVYPNLNFCKPIDTEILISAYTVAELMLMMPLEKYNIEIETYPKAAIFYVEFDGEEETRCFSFKEEKNLANTLGEILIHLCFYKEVQKTD
jgi:hypothetical protein